MQLALNGQLDCSKRSFAEYDTSERDHGVSMVYGIRTSEGVYVIPRANPEELHNTQDIIIYIYICILYIMLYIIYYIYIVLVLCHLGSSSSVAGASALIAEGCGFELYPGWSRIFFWGFSLNKKFWHDVAPRRGTLRRLASYCELGFQLFGSHRDYIGWIISKIFNTELCECFETLLRERDPGKNRGPMVAEKGQPHPLSAQVKLPAVVLLTARGFF